MKIRSGNGPRFAWLIIATFIALAASLVLQYVTDSKLPSHEGKTIAEWFDRAVIEESPGCMPAPRNFESQQVIIEFGSDAIPFLVEVAQKKESKLSGLYDSLVIRLPLPLAMRIPISDNWQVPRRRSTAINLLGRIAAKDGNCLNDRKPTKKHESVVNCFLACLQTNEPPAVRVAVIKALPALGSEAVSILVNVLRDNDAATAAPAVTALGELGVCNPEAIDELQRLAWSTNSFELKIASLKAMSQLVANISDHEHSSVSEAVAKAFRPMCDHRNRYIRQEVAILMWQSGHPEFVIRELDSQQMANSWFMLDRLKTEGHAAAVFTPQIQAIIDEPSKDYLKVSAHAVLAAIQDSKP